MRLSVCACLLAAPLALRSQATFDPPKHDVPTGWHNASLVPDAVIGPSNRAPDLGALTPDFAQVERPAGLPRPASNRLLAPRATGQCLAPPEATYWRSRDLGLEIQFIARQGFLPVTAAGAAPLLRDACWFPAGWRAYAFVVPARQKLRVALEHPEAGWFRLVMVDRWGLPREGMVQGADPAVVSYANPMGQPNTVYVLVDDPGWRSSEEAPFTLTVERSWDPARPGAPALPMVMGVWAQVRAAKAP